jgi:hypothetical protein
VISGVASNGPGRERFGERPPAGFNHCAGHYVGNILSRRRMNHPIRVLERMTFAMGRGARQHHRSFIHRHRQVQKACVSAHDHVGMLYYAGGHD